MKRVVQIAVSLVLLLLISLAAAVAWNWAPDRSLADLKPRWALPPSEFLAIDGMLVHLRDQGPRDDPAPIVLLHGTSASLHTWEGWVAVLQAKRRVISLDLPGFGLTGPFPDGDYRMAHYSAFLANVLDQLQVPRAVVAGNSFGGQLAWQFALDHPQRVERLVLVDAAGYPRNATSIPIGFRLAQIPALAPLMANLLPRAMIEASVRNVYGDPSQVTDELVDRYYELTLRAGNRAALSQRFNQAEAGQAYSRITALKMPTLIIWGGRDQLIPPVNGEYFKRDIEGSRLVLFENLGHVPQEEDSARTVAVLKRFLEG